MFHCDTGVQFAFAKVNDFVQGDCIPYSRKCDGEIQCRDGEDEFECGGIVCGELQYI